MSNQAMATITNIDQLNSDTFAFTVHCPDAARTAQPGQFIHVSCSSDATMLRRPISIYDIDTMSDTISFILQVRGKGTAQLARSRPGQTLDLLAPLGRGFDVSPRNAVCVVGGGIGIFPLFAVLKAHWSAHKVALLGFAGADKITCREEFSSLSDKLLVCTDDGSSGYHGNTAQALASGLQAGYRPDIIYACGPLPMLKAIALLAKEYDIPCEVSLEERMACGIGACLVCACKTKTTSENGWQHSHVCVDGPVFDSRRVVWE